MTEHLLYTDVDFLDTPMSERKGGIFDSNGDVVLGLCKVCGKGEAELEGPCTGNSLKRLAEELKEILPYIEHDAPVRWEPHLAKKLKETYKVLIDLSSMDHVAAAQESLAVAKKIISEDSSILEKHGLTLNHFEFMVRQMMAYPMPVDKQGRWLGWLQAGISSYCYPGIDLGFFKELNRKHLK